MNSKDLRISSIAMKIAGIRKIEKDFERELQKAIDNKETVSFDYVNKQGKSSLVQLTPSKIENKWGKKVVTGITKWGKEFSFLIDSIGKTESESPAPVKKENLIVLKDDCDFEREIQKAIDSDSKIQFSYLMKNGNRTKITMKPTKIENKWGQRVCTGETYSGERSYIIMSMGNNSMGKEEMFKKYAFLKGKLFYGKINGSYCFFRPVAVADEKIECEKLDGKTYTSYYKDGDVDDGDYGWECKYEETKMYPGKVVGKELLEVKNNTLYFNGKELKPMDPKSYLSWSSQVGETKHYKRNGRYWDEIKSWD